MTETKPMTDCESIDPLLILNRPSHLNLRKIDKRTLMTILSEENDDFLIDSEIFYISNKDFKGIKVEDKAEYKVTLKFSVFRERN